MSSDKVVAIACNRIHSLALRGAKDEIFYQYFHFLNQAYMLISIKFCLMAAMLI